MHNVKNKFQKMKRPAEKPRQETQEQITSSVIGSNLNLFLWFSVGSFGLIENAITGIEQYSNARTIRNAAIA